MTSRVMLMAVSVVLVLGGCGGDPGRVEPDAAARPASTSSLIEAAPIEAEYEAFDGREFLFRVKHGRLERFGYAEWRTAAAPFAERIPYAAYVGTRAKLAPAPVRGSDGRAWYAALAADGATVFAPSHDETPDAFAAAAGICFVDTVASAENRIGTTVWLRRRGASTSGGWHITRDVDVTVARRHLEPLVIEAVDTGMYGHASADVLYFAARTEDGTEVLLENRPETFFESDPIDAAWGEDVRRLIRSETARRGMTREQVRLAWGNPVAVRDLGGGSERWEYATGERVEFVDGVMAGGKARR